MSDTNGQAKFKITYEENIGKIYEWKLYEWKFKPFLYFFKQGYWQLLQYGETKKHLEDRIKEITKLEKSITYYNKFGDEDLMW